MSFHRMFFGVFTLTILYFVPTFGSRQNLRNLININTFNIKHVLEEVLDLRYDIQILNKTCAMDEELVNNAKESQEDASIDSESENNNIKSELVTKIDSQQLLNGFTDLKLEMHKSLGQVREDQMCVINRTEHIENNLRALEVQLQNQSAQTKSKLLHISDGIVKDTRQIGRDYNELKLSMNSIQTEIQSVEENSKWLSSETKSLRDDVNDVKEKCNSTEESINSFQRELADLKKKINLLYDLTDSYSWEFFQGSFYRLFQQKHTFDSANKFCADRNSYLAVITSEKENTFLTEMVTASVHSVWLGGDDKQIEGHWEWKSKELFLYTNWNSGEPNNEDGTEDCVIMYHFGRWNDESCTAKLPFICEKKI